MSNEKIKLTVEIYERKKETHEVTVDKEAYDKKGFSIFDHISEASVVDIDNTSDYEIIEEKECG